MASANLSQRVNECGENIVHEFKKPEDKAPFDREIARKELKTSTMYVTVMDRIDHHIHLSVQQIAKYGRWAMRTRFILPLLSAFATGLATIAAGAQGTKSDMAAYIA